MDKDTAMISLAETFWGRSPTQAERDAMRGEMERDARAIAPIIGEGSGALFGVEPAAFDALMSREARR